MRELSFLIIGSILTFLSTWIIEGRKDKIKNKENEKTIKSLLKQELYSVYKDMEKLKTVLEYKNYFELQTIDLLIEKVSNLNNYKKDLTNLPRLKDREVVIELISDIRSFLSDVRILEGMYLDDVKRDITDPEKIGGGYFNQKRLEKLVTLVELQRRTEESYKRFD